MFCQHCGKPIPDGASHCSFCGAPVDEPSPRHARPEDDELYSYSDRHISDDKDSTRVFDPNRDPIDETKVYNFAAFEGQGDGYDPNLDPNYDPNYDPNFDPNYDPNYDPRYPDGPVPIGDDYENYQDGQSDDTFMDKVDQRFRRDDYDDYEDGRGPRKKKSKAWIWITVIVIVVSLIAALAFAVFSGNLFGKNNAKPTTPRATVAATAKPTQAPATQAPRQTQAPAPTEAPRPTQAPAPTQAPQIVTEAPRIVTEAPAPTQPPAPTQAPATEAVQEY